MRTKVWSLSLCDWPFPKHHMYKVAENQKCTKRHKTELEHLTVKSTLNALNPGVQTFVRFAVGLTVSKIQDCQKSAMHRVTPN